MFVWGQGGGSILGPGNTVVTEIDTVPFLREHSW